MLEVKEATKVYGEGEAMVIALDQVSLSVNKGDYIAIMGPSGSGKSTLLNVIGGLDRISSGEVTLDGKRIDNIDENSLVEVRRKKIAYVFQQYHLLPSLTALENVYMPLLFGGSKQPLERALEYLNMVGLGKRANHKPSQLSGGEQQRVAIARAIIHNPSLILADEPTGNMDQKTGNDIMDIFARLNQEGIGIIMVTHSREVAQRAKSIVNLKDGRLVERITNN
jgi:putative ABC transport system ATP-binding protein